jgi:hypothetical protein
MYAGRVITGEIKNVHTVRTGNRIHGLARELVHEDGEEPAQR